MREQSLNLFQRRDELDELEGFQQQELAKVKHMVRAPPAPPRPVSSGPGSDLLCWSRRAPGGPAQPFPFLVPTLARPFDEGCWSHRGGLVFPASSSCRRRSPWPTWSGSGRPPRGSWPTRGRSSRPPAPGPPAWPASCRSFGSSARSWRRRGGGRPVPASCGGGGGLLGPGTLLAGGGGCLVWELASSAWRWR